MQIVREPRCWLSNRSLHHSISRQIKGLGHFCGNCRLVGSLSIMCVNPTKSILQLYFNLWEMPKRQGEAGCRGRPSEQVMAGSIASGGRRWSNIGSYGIYQTSCLKYGRLRYIFAIHYIMATKLSDTGQTFALFISLSLILFAQFALIIFTVWEREGEQEARLLRAG